MSTSEVESFQARLGTKNIIVAGCTSRQPNIFAEICRGISAEGSVRGIVTKAGSPFVDIPRLGREFRLYTDQNDFRPHHLPQLHIELAGWAHILVIAPADANTIAKIAGGLADDLVTRVVKAWDYRKMFILAPDIHPMMWRNPSTQSNLNVLRNFGASIVDPINNTGVMDTPRNVTAQIRTIIALVDIGAGGE